MSLKYTVKLIKNGTEIESAPASKMNNAKAWGAVAKKRHGGGEVQIVENKTGWMAR